MLEVLKLSFISALALCLVLSHKNVGDSMEIDEFVNSSSKCPNLPSDYRYHKETGRCYRVGFKGPCRELMIFTMEDNDDGVCDCDLGLRCGRPLVYSRKKRRCYFVNEQGPCRPGKWLVFGSNLRPLCKRNACLNEEKAQPSNLKHYWFQYNNTCYRTYTKGYCLGDGELLFHQDNHYRPTCTTKFQCDLPILNSFGFQKLECYPGQRNDILRKCQHVFMPVAEESGRHIIKTSISHGIGVHCLFCEERKDILGDKF